MDEKFKEVQNFCNRNISGLLDKHHAHDRYYVKISDNGIGVLQSDLPFIFDKGFTGDTSSQKQSTGMGLFLVKKICDDLQVEIDAESNFDRGFTIQLLFPKV